MDEEARELLERGDLFEVLDHQHPEFSLHVSFDDQIAHEYDAALDRIADEITDLPEVVTAVREDREVILVGGSITAAALESWLRSWWRFELTRQTHSKGSPARPSFANRLRRLWPRDRH